MQRLAGYLLVIATATACKVRPASSVVRDDTSAAPPSSDQSLVDYNADIPPRGRSLFDYVVLSKGKLPNTFEGLSDLLFNQARATKSAFTLIPYGRSLQKYACDMAHPRVILNANVHVGPASCSEIDTSRSDQIFIAYSEVAKALEIISYNEAAGRMEFQVVHDFAPGMEPKVYYARRSFCTSCHQSAGPLFPRVPWLETTGTGTLGAEPTRLTEQVSAALNDADLYHGLPIKTQKTPSGGTDFNGNPTFDMKRENDRFQDAAAALDIRSAESNDMVFAQQIWRDGCGTDQQTSYQCRLLIAKLAAEKFFAQRAGLLQVDPKSANYISLRDIWQKNWPKAGIPRMGFQLPNRPDLPFVKDQEMTDARIDSLKPDKPLSAAENPLTPKPDLAKGALGADTPMTSKVNSRPETIPQSEFTESSGFGVGVATSFSAGGSSPNSVIVAFRTSVYDQFMKRFKSELHIGKPPSSGADEEDPFGSLPSICNAAQGKFCGSGESCINFKCKTGSKKGAACNLTTDIKCQALLQCQLGLCQTGPGDGEACDEAKDVKCSQNFDKCIDHICSVPTVKIAGDRERLFKALESERLKPLISAPQFEGWKIASALFEELGAAPIPPECYPSAVTLPDPKVLNGTDSVTGLDPIESETMSLVKTNCGACHSGTGEANMDFADSISAIKTRRLDLLKRLGWESADLSSGSQMPPKNSPSGKALRTPTGAADRFRLITDLQALDTTPP